MAEYVFTLRNVRKAHGDKVVLDNVTLSFLHGAKIGVVGPNGTGKSTLLKIMAGLETANNGDAILDPGATVGMLQQEPPLTEGTTVLQNVEEAVAGIKGKLDRYNEISEQLADPDADYDTLLAEMGDLQTDLDHANAWDLDSRLDQAMDALRCPPPDAVVDNLSGGERRRVALCKLLLEQPSLLLLEHPDSGPGVEDRVPIVGRLEPGHDLEQGRLAGAVGADHPDLGTGIEGQRDVVQHDLVTVGLAHVAQGEHVLRHGQRA